MLFLCVCLCLERITGYMTARSIVICIISRTYMCVFFIEENKALKCDSVIPRRSCTHMHKSIVNLSYFPPGLLFLSCLSQEPCIISHPGPDLPHIPVIRIQPLQLRYDQERRIFTGHAASCAHTLRQGL